MKKRWLSAALCTAMVAGSLAGCGLKSPETTTTAAATEAAKEEATTAAEAKEESKGDRKSTRLNSSHTTVSRMPSSA